MDRTATVTKALWCLPSIDVAWRGDCLAGLRAEHLFVVDNSPPNPNLFVSRSWNLGIQEARDIGADYMVICSEAVRFGAAGGLDFEEALDGHPVVLSYCVGWHLIALSLDLLNTVGDFDENLPTYGQDRDYMVRMHLAGLPSPGYNDQPIPQVSLDVSDAGVAHSITDGFVSADFPRMTRYLERKWGDPAPGRHFPHPFNNPRYFWSQWPVPVRLRAGT